LSADHRFDASVEEVGRVTECGGEVGRLNVVGGAEVCSFAFCGHSKFSHLIFAVGRQRVVFIEKQPACFFVVVRFLVQYSFFFSLKFLRRCFFFPENSLGKFDVCSG